MNLPRIVLVRARAGDCTRAVCFGGTPDQPSNPRNARKTKIEPFALLCDMPERHELGHREAMRGNKAVIWKE
jgi:hypothetical protein